MKRSPYQIEVELKKMFEKPYSYFTRISLRITSFFGFKPDTLFLILNIFLYTIYNFKVSEILVENLNKFSTDVFEQFQVKSFCGLYL